MNTPIPEWAEKAAQEAYDRYANGEGADVRDCIARAVMREREASDERAAKIAEQSGSWVAESDDGGGKGPSKGVWRGLTAPEIASAIRDRSKT